MPRRTRLTPAELYLRPPLLDAVQCPPHLMPAFHNPPPTRAAAMVLPLPPPPPRRTPQIEKYLSGEELAAFRRAYSELTGGQAELAPAGAHAALPAAQVIQHPVGGSVVNLAAFRAAREARTIRPAGGAGDVW